MKSSKLVLNNVTVAVLFAIFSMVLMLFQFFYIGIVIRSSAEKESGEIASLTALEVAKSIQVYFRDALTITQTYADNFKVYKQNKIPRRTIYNLMKGSLEYNNKFLAIWTMWEPNAYDNMDKFFANDNVHDLKGNFAIAYYYEGNEIKQEINDTSDYYENFYTIPKIYRKPVIMDPFYYQYHGNEKVYFETSLVSPVIVDSVFLGIIGIDIDMYSLQKMFGQKSVYSSGTLAILSNSGQIVSHKSIAYVDQNISKYTSKEPYSIIDSLKQGKEFITESVSMIDKKEVMRYYFPINIEYMAAPWYVVIDIPKDEIFKKSESIKSIAGIFLVASLLLLSYLIFNITDRRRKEKKLLKNFEELKTSQDNLNEAYSKLNESNKILEAIFNQTFSYVNLLDTEGNIVAVNKPVYEFFNKFNIEITGSLFKDLPWWNNTEEKQKVEDAVKYAEPGKNITFESVYEDNNVSIHFLFSVKSVLGADGKSQFILAEGIDISKIKETEKELENYKNHLENLVKERTEELATTVEELRLSNEELTNQKLELQTTIKDLHLAQNMLIQSEKMASLGILTAGVAHEINNPLNFIQGGIWALESYFKSNLKGHLSDVEVFIHSIKEGVARSAKIVTSLSQYSKQDDTPKDNCNLHEIIDNCLIMLNHQTVDRIKIIKNYTNQPHTISCLESKLHQVFLNILSNAVDSIDNLGEINISSKVINDRILIIIEDNGYGMSQKDLQRIMDPFFTTKEPGKGTGLGLFISYSIIKEHNGNMRFESEINKGTKVFVDLPVNPISKT